MNIARYFLIIIIFVFCSCDDDLEGLYNQNITPNLFRGTDTERIQQAIDSAKKSINEIIIPAFNSNGSKEWLLDSAILLPSDFTIILENCSIRLSDKCRDNMFRSNNVGIGIKEPNWNYNINIIGIGNVVLRGANNPRSTGDFQKNNSLTPKEGESYGSDAGKKGMKRTGDWRNIMIHMAYVDRFRFENVKIVNSHAWGMSFERVINANISNIVFDNPAIIYVNDKQVQALNKDGINLRQGCKNFMISNISGTTGDDFIALTNLVRSSNNAGELNSTMVTCNGWKGKEDNIENIFIYDIDCKGNYGGITIRASDSASINNVYLDRIKYSGLFNTILLDGIIYGISLPRMIKNIEATNITGNGSSLIHIAAPIADCRFKYGTYYGSNEIITYGIDQNETSNVLIENMGQP